MCLHLHACGGLGCVAQTHPHPPTRRPTARTYFARHFSQPLHLATALLLINSQNSHLQEFVVMSELIREAPQHAHSLPPLLSKKHSEHAQASVAGGGEAASACTASASALAWVRSGGACDFRGLDNMMSKLSIIESKLLPSGRDGAWDAGNTALPPISSPPMPWESGAPCPATTASGPGGDSALATSMGFDCGVGLVVATGFTDVGRGALMTGDLTESQADVILLGLPDEAECVRAGRSQEHWAPRQLLSQYS